MGSIASHLAFAASTPMKVLMASSVKLLCGVETRSPAEYTVLRFISRETTLANPASVLIVSSIHARGSFNDPAEPSLLELRALRDDALATWRYVPNVRSCRDPVFFGVSVLN